MRHLDKALAIEWFGTTVFLAIVQLTLHLTRKDGVHAAPAETTSVFLIGANQIAVAVVLAARRLGERKFANRPGKKPQGPL